MFYEEQKYVSKQYWQLDSLFDHIMSRDIHKTFYIDKNTLMYAKENAVYCDENFGEESGLVRLYMNGVGMTIIYSKIEESKNVYPIKVVSVDGSENIYYFTRYPASSTTF